MKISLLLALAFLSFISLANIKYFHGIVGMTIRDGGIGCICHNLSPNDSVAVWIEGPDSVIINSTHQYKIFLSGGPSVAGGFNLAANHGSLDSADTLTQVLFGELTHTLPNQFIGDTISWTFQYTAPDSLITDTIYSVGNSVNWDSIPSDFDQWNFGENFAIHIFDNPVNLIVDNKLVYSYILYQNYPNPFNPSTIINWESTADGWQSMKVYDIEGKSVTTLINGYKTAGKYQVEFNASGLPSGIYFYTLECNGFSQTRKMLLLK